MLVAKKSLNFDGYMVTSNMHRCSKIILRERFRIRVVFFTPDLTWYGGSQHRTALRGALWHYTATEHWIWCVGWKVIGRLE